MFWKTAVSTWKPVLEEDGGKGSGRECRLLWKIVLANFNESAKWLVVGRAYGSSVLAPLPVLSLLDCRCRTQPYLIAVPALLLLILLIRSCCGC